MITNVPIRARSVNDSQLRPARRDARGRKLLKPYEPSIPLRPWRKQLEYRSTQFFEGFMIVHACIVARHCRTGITAY